MCSGLHNFKDELICIVPALDREFLPETGSCNINTLAPNKADIFWFLEDTSDTRHPFEYNCKC